MFRKSQKEEIKRDNQENVSATLDQKLVKSSDAEKPIENFEKNEVERVNENSLNDAPNEKIVKNRHLKYLKRSCRFVQKIRCIVNL